MVRVHGGPRLRQLVLILDAFHLEFFGEFVGTQNILQFLAFLLGTHRHPSSVGRIPVDGIDIVELGIGHPVFEGEGAVYAVWEGLLVFDVFGEAKVRVTFIKGLHHRRIVIIEHYWYRCLLVKNGSTVLKVRNIKA